MKKRYIIAVLLLFSLKIPAQKKVNITHEIAITIPEQCIVSFDDEKKVLLIGKNDYKCQVKFLPFDDGFSILDSEWQNKRKLDTLFFEDLRNASLIKTEKNMLFDFGKDYMKKTYYDSCIYNVTYTTHTTEGMYLYRFTTKNESLLQIFDKMLGTIDYYRGNLWRRTQYAYSTSLIPLIISILITIPCALLHRKGKIWKNLLNAIIIFLPSALIICMGFAWDLGLILGLLILLFLLAVSSSVFGFYII